MEQKNHSNPDPSKPAEGRFDEVDQSKGIFPPNVPHPEGAETRLPGKLGGGPYEESGRGGVAGVGRSLDQPNPAVESASGGETSGETTADERDAEDQEPKGALPP
jgi:hypothetical protein